MPISERVTGRLKEKAQRVTLARRVALPASAALRIEETAGAPLLIAALFALAAANSPWAASYLGFWDTHVSIDLGFAVLDKSLRHWINEALLPLFFFVIGLDLRSELVHGSLSGVRRAVLPVALAAGGILVPVAFYLAVNRDSGSYAAWSVPVATDVAFVVAILSLLRDRVPGELKVLALAFAAVDDVGGVLIIAFVYSGDLAVQPVLAGAAVYALILLLGWLRVWSALVYVALGVALWALALESGIHPTLVGVALGLLLPARPVIGPREFHRRARELLEEFADDDWTGAAPPPEQARRPVESFRRAELLGRFDVLLEESESSAARWTRLVNPWVSYFVLPLFALSNAGVNIDASVGRQALESPLAWGIAAGLVLGKPLGLLGGAWVVLRLGLAKLPPPVEWRHLAGLGLLGGIGFTLSIFLAELALGGQPTLAVAKVSVLVSSLVAAALGFSFLRAGAAQRRAGTGDDEAGKERK